MLFATIGRTGEDNSGDGTAYSKARLMAKEKVAKKEAKTVEAGVELVFKENPDLYAQHREESRRAAH
jgi:hypothetical protein